jgi:hypothetical protein
MTLLSRLLLGTLLSFLLLAAIETAQAQALLWEQAVKASQHGVLIPGGSDPNRAPKSIAIDAQGDVYVVGNGFRTVKFSGATGVPVWQKTPQNLQSGNAYAVALTPAGDILVTGVTSTNGANGNTNIRTIKYAGADGAVLWDKEFDSPHSATSQDTAYGVVSDAAGNAIVTGAMSNAQGSKYFQTIKYSSTTGAVIWERTHDTSGVAWAVTVDAADNALVAGRSYNGSTYDHVFFKYAANDGATLWTRTVPTTISFMEVPLHIAADPQGNLVATVVNYTSNYNAIVVKLAAADGVVLWSKTLDGGGFDAIFSIAVDAVGNVLATGVTGPAPFDSRFWTAKLAAADGTTMWEHIRTTGTQTAGAAVAVDGAGDVWVAGRGDLNGDSIATFKFAGSNGAVIVEKHYQGPPGTDSGGRSIAVDAAGNAAVAGFSRNTMGDDDLKVIKYAAGNGAQLWESAEVDFLASSNWSAIKNGYAIDSAGNILLVGLGITGCCNSVSHALVAKYAGSTGQPIWERKFAGPTPRYDANVAVSADAANDVVAAGWRADTVSGPHRLNVTKHAGADGAVLWSRDFDASAENFYNAIYLAFDSTGNAFVASRVFVAGVPELRVLKLGAANGATLWQWSHPLPSNASSIAGLAMDPSGNAFLAATIMSPGGVGDWKTVKLAAASGALLWESAFNGAANLSDAAFGLAVDVAGNVFVTGNVRLPGNDADFMTVKYAAANGQALWQKSLGTLWYNQARDDAAYAIALDATGDVIVTGRGGVDGSSVMEGATTLKYRSSDGELLWRSNFEASPSQLDTSLSIDAGGNVVIADLNGGIKLTKLSASNGEMLWQSVRAGDQLFGSRAHGSGVYVISHWFDFYGSQVDISKYDNPAQDTVPAPFSFQSPARAAPSAAQTSNTIVPVGYDSATPIGVTNGEYSIGCNGTFTTSSGTLNRGQSVCVRHVSSAQMGQSVTTTLTIGGVQGTFQSTTNAHPLVINIVGGGSGTLAFTSGAPFTCSPTCVLPHPGHQLGLTAQPAVGSTFAGWSGCDDTNGNLCFVAQNAPYTLTVTLYAGGLRTSDFSGDGRSDLLWYNTATGMLYQSQMDGFTLGASGVIDQETNLSWKVAAVGDLDGDGRADVVWQNNATGQVYGLLMNGTTVVAEGTIYTEPNLNWKVVGAGDFNGDGNADLLWKNNATGDVFLLLMSGLNVITGGVVYSEPSANWQIQKVADFNGDSRADVLWRNVATGDVFVLLMNWPTVTGGGVVYSEPNTAWQIQAAADFNGDGRADILWRNTTTGDVFMMLMNGTTITGGSVFYGEPNADWKIVATGDYNGDGRADILWRNTATGQVFMMLMDGFTLTSGGFVYTEPDQNWTILGP